MAKHLVTCVECGKRFDTKYGYYYDKNSRRYTCRKCGNKMNAVRNEQYTGMRQSTGAMIAKIVVGILFILVGFTSPESGWSIGYFMTALVLGCSLIAWGVVPYLKAKKATAAEAEEKENEVKVCPACGATTKGKYCEYCGTKL